MSKVQFYFLAAFLLIIALNACNSAGDKYKQEIAVVDSLQISLDEVVHEYRMWDMDELAGIKDKIELNLKALTDEMKANKDTLLKDQAIMLGNYKSSSKVFRDLAVKDKQFLEAISLTEEQLLNLKTDLSKGAITSQDSINAYIEDEKKSVGILVAGLQKANRRFKMGKGKFELMNPQVKQILDSLLKRNDN